MNLVVKDNPNFVRDSNTKAIINVDSESYTIAVNRKKKLLEQQDRIVELQQQLDDLLQWKQQIIEMLEKKSDK